jgi:hypothetical protein
VCLLRAYVPACLPAYVLMVLRVPTCLCVPTCLHANVPTFLRPYLPTFQESIRTFIKRNNRVPRRAFLRSMNFLGTSQREHDWFGVVWGSGDQHSQTCTSLGRIGNFQRLNINNDLMNSEAFSMLNNRYFIINICLRNYEYM